ncbi:MAG: hypothetical protein ACI4QU_04940, partial [Christensenellales bacterium]
LCLVTSLVFVACGSNGNSDDTCYINGVPVDKENFIEGVETIRVTSDENASGWATNGEGENERYTLEKGEEGYVYLWLKKGYAIGDLQIKANGTVYDFVKDEENGYYRANFGKVNGSVKIEFIGSTALKFGSLSVLIYDAASTYGDSSKLRFNVKLDGDESLDGTAEYSLYGLTSLIGSLEFNNKIGNLNQTQKLSISVWKVSELSETGKEICIFGKDFVKFDCETTSGIESEIDVSFNDETLKTTYTVTLYDYNLTIGIGTEYEYPENTAANYKLKQHIKFYSMEIGEEKLTYIIDGIEYPAKDNLISLDKIVSAESIKLKVAIPSLVMKLKSIGMFEKCFIGSLNNELTFTDNGDNVVVDLCKWYDNGITDELLRDNYYIEFTPESGMCDYDIFWKNVDSIEGIKNIEVIQDASTNKYLYTYSDTVLNMSLFDAGTETFDEYYVVEENADFSFYVSALGESGNISFTIGEDVFDLGFSYSAGEFLLDTSALPAGYTIDYDTHTNQFKITVSAEKVASINVIK